jgi:hypothetical protein
MSPGLATSACERQARLSAIQSLDLTLLIQTQHQSVIGVRKSASRRLKYRWRTSANPGEIAMDKGAKVREETAEKRVVRTTEELRSAMRHLAWIAPGIGFHNHFSEGRHNTTKALTPIQGRKCGFDATYAIRHTLLRYSPANAVTSKRQVF